MDSLILYRPSELTRLSREFDRMLEDSLNWPLYEPFRFFRDRSSMFMPIDIQQTKDHVIVSSTLPGVKLEDVDISIENNVLTIKGETKEHKETKEAEYVRRESFTGEFCRSVGLPDGLGNDKAEATMDNGLLTIKIPRLEEAKPKSIKVKPTTKKQEK